MSAIIAKLVYWNRMQIQRNIDGSPSSTLSVWPVVITTQIIQGLEVFATCCLNLPPFLRSLQSGFMHADDLRRRGQAVTDLYGFELESTYKDDTPKTQDSDGLQDRQSREAVGASGIPQIPPIPHISSNNHNVSICGGQGENAWDAGSQSSQSHIIKQTRTYAVDHHLADSAATESSAGRGLAI
ncbi:MAG: hypothetical protein Q9220_003204 [cf. Caloplaca sp. 1 TL-2023]